MCLMLFPGSNRIIATCIDSWCLSDVYLTHLSLHDESDSECGATDSGVRIRGHGTTGRGHALQRLLSRGVGRDHLFLQGGGGHGQHWDDVRSVSRG